MYLFYPILSFFAVTLFLSCSDNPRLDFPSEDDLRQKTFSSAENSSSVGESLSSNSEIDVSSSSSDSDGSVEESSSSNSETDASSSSSDSDGSVEESSSSNSETDVYSSSSESSNSVKKSSSSSMETGVSSYSSGSSSSLKESSSSSMETEVSSSSSGSSSSVKESSSSNLETGVSSSSSESSNSGEFSSSSESSSSSVVLSSSSEVLCGEIPYDFDTEFCYNNSKKGSLCGANPQKSYNPDLYECKSDINPNGIYLISGVGSYNAVLIGSQTWMTENFNKNTRYYWSAAMNISQNYDVYPYQQSGRARGICPSGWHLPSSSEWTTLKNFINNSAGTNVSAVKLKATSGWESSNGTDDYGFTALPLGSNCWWSSSEVSNYNAYYWGMNNSEDIYVRSQDKSTYCSVRCLKD